MEKGRVNSKIGSRVKSGFTIIEMTVAILILSIATAMFSSAIILANKQSTKSTDLATKSSSQLQLLKDLEGISDGIDCDTLGNPKIEIKESGKRLEVVKGGSLVVFDAIKYAKNNGTQPITLGYTQNGNTPIIELRYGGETYWIPIIKSA